jgi:hypothetical protein
VALSEAPDIIDLSYGNNAVEMTSTTEGTTMTTIEQTYMEFVHTSLLGRTIMDVRPMKSDELKLFGWDLSYGSEPMVIILDDLTAIIPSQDPEGNGPGHLFVTEAEYTS